MDWELYERQRATLVFVGVALICFLLLAFQRSSAVQHIKAFFVSCTLPTQRLFSRMTSSAPVEPPPPPPVPVVSGVSPEDVPVTPENDTDSHAEHSRALRVVTEQNARLTGLLELKRSRWPRLVAAHVVSRDPQKWFQELLLDKGEAEGIQEDDGVIAIAGNREALVGRVMEVGTHTSRVMLIHDSLSSVAAAVAGAAGEDGVVEGSNSHDLYLKYLNRDSQVKIGDLVLTSGLGKTFPEGIPIGWVREIELDQRQLFLQARVSPALASPSLRVVGILIRRE